MLAALLSIFAAPMSGEKCVSSLHVLGYGPYILHVTSVPHSRCWCAWQVVMRPAMHQAEAVTGQKGEGAEAEAVGVEGPAGGGGVRVAEELVQRAKVSHYRWCSPIPICTLMLFWEMHTLFQMLQTKLVVLQTLAPVSA